VADIDEKARELAHEIAASRDGAAGTRRIAAALANARDAGRAALREQYAAGQRAMREAAITVLADQFLDAERVAFFVRALDWSTSSSPQASPPSDPRPAHSCPSCDTDDSVSVSGRLIKATPVGQPDPRPDDARIYPCDDCGLMRNAAEGGGTFTVCDACWDKRYGKPAKSDPRPGSETVLLPPQKDMDPADLAILRANLDDLYTTAAPQAEPRAPRICARTGCDEPAVRGSNQCQPHTDVPVQAEPRGCTCLGSCKGAAGLAPGWRCALAKAEPRDEGADGPCNAFTPGWCEDAAPTPRPAGEPLLCDCGWAGNALEATAKLGGLLCPRCDAVVEEHGRAADEARPAEVVMPVEREPITGLPVVRPGPQVAVAGSVTDAIVRARAKAAEGTETPEAQAVNTTRCGASFDVTPYFISYGVRRICTMPAGHNGKCLFESEVSFPPKVEP
jgi:hypothetical protein